MPEYPPSSLLLACLLGLALGYDVATRQIPNWVIVAGLVLGIGCSMFAAPVVGLDAQGSGRLGLNQSLLGAVTGLAIMLPFYLLRVMGAGDAKLMAAIGTFLGPVNIAGAALLTFVAGGVMALMVALWARSLRRVLANLHMMARAAFSGHASGVALREVPTTGRLPYACAIAVGTGLQLSLGA